MMCNKFKTWKLKRESCPTSDDLESEELKKITKRLKGDSEKETLTNILEWQDRNIQFWWERGRFGPLALIISLSFSFLLCYSKFPYVFTLFIFALFIILAAFFVVLSSFNIMRKAFYPLLFFLFVYPLINLALRIPVQAHNIFQYTLFYVGALGATALTVVCLSIRYEMFWRGEPVKEKISKFKEVIDDTFRLGGLPVDKVIEYKLAICRDYAKLTASLLFKVYPDSKLYFIAISGHVAVAVKIRDNYYVLDQHLPILRIDKWLIKRKKEKADVYVSEVLRDSAGEPMKVTFSWHETIPRLPKINTEKLAEEIAKILGITQSSQKNEPDFDIPLPNYAIYYDDDDIIKYSLIKAIKNKLESELCSNLDKISKIEIIQDGKDLKLNVYLNNVKMNTENQILRVLQ
jgi:predicted transglutaminase-like protease